MAANTAAAFSRGDLVREIRQLKDRVKVLETRRDLEAASIGRGGLRVLDGFIVILDAQGDEQMRLSTEGLSMEGLLSVIGAILVTGGGDITVEDGGAFNALDGSRIVARYADGTSAVLWGSLVADETGDPSGHGLLIQDDNAGSNKDILRAKRDPAGLKLVFVGQTTNDIPDPVDAMRVWASDIELVQVGSGDLVNEIISILADSRVFIGADADDIDLDAADDIFISADDQVQLISGTDLVFASSGTTSNSPNVELGGAFAAFRRSTSSRRYKTDIDGYAAPRTILDLAPRSYRDKAEAEADPDTARSHVGLVAEEVHDLGLHEYITYDEQGRPDAVRYDRLAVGLLGIVQDLAGWAQAQGWVPRDGSALPVPPPSPAPAPKPRERSRADPRGTTGAVPG